ncbi:MAG TPA: hypothetical protein VM076_08000 [Gemmatimonadaceae bacterium]|nr:hypothetical protein [Gemmatimonadaceae bacterium]
MALDLTNFDLHEMLRCGRELRDAVRSAGSVEEAAGVVVRYFYDACVDPNSERRSCVLARFYKTHAYGALPPDLQDFAADLLAGTAPTPAMQCLTLLATAGARPEWNDRRLSRGHRAVPLPSPEIVEQAPMIAQLVRQMGLDIAAVVRPSPDLLRSAEGKTYSVFHVEEAAGSPYIPAQTEFVVPHGVRSVLGFGGLHRHDFFAVILFATVPIPRAAADRFRNIALDLKAALHTLPETRVFQDASV